MIDENIIPSKYPILVLPMNGVSDGDLATAVSNAGAFPSISVFNYYQNKSIVLDYLNKDLQKFSDATGHSNILISMHWEDFLKIETLELLLKNEIKFIELFIRPLNNELWEVLSNKISEVRKLGMKIFFKTAKLLPVSEFDAIILKGPNGAGRTFFDGNDLQTSFDNFSKTVGSDKIIPSGGIGNYNDTQYFLNQGALAVGIGTLIAASEESKVSLETKKRIIESTSKDIVNIGPLNCRGLLFSLVDKDDDNNSRSLREGIKGTESGCIYVGNGIDYINEILPVKTIIERLIYNADQ